MQNIDINDIFNQTSSKIKTISVTSGKGGVGKSNIVVNLAIQLARMGKRVLIIDADFGLANIDILLNLQPVHTIEEFLNSSTNLESIIMRGPLGIHIIPSASGIPEMADMTLRQQKFLIDALSKLQSRYDYMIIDTGAGISPNVLRFNASVDDVLIVTNTEPTSLTDAYAIMKILSTKYRLTKFTLIVNNCTVEGGKKIYTLLSGVARNHEHLFRLEFGGSLPTDLTIQSSIKARVAHSLMFPNSKLTMAFERLAKNLAMNISASSSENNATFWNRFLKWKAV